MDDDLEDEVFYQTIISHTKLISRFILSIPFHPSITNFTRYAKFYLAKPECIVAILLTLIILAVFSNLESVLKSAAGKLQYVGATYTFVTSLPFKNIRHEGSDEYDGHRMPLFKKDPSTVNDEIGPSVSWKIKYDDCAAYSVKGRRPHMEDRFCVLQHEHFKLYGIFDGHGGEAAAQFVKDHLLVNISEKVAKVFDDGDENIGKFSEILSQQILAVDKQLLVELKNKKDIGGTTVIVALVTKDELIVANVGDSRAVMCDGFGSTQPLTYDHKPQQPKERNRIQNAGGFVSFNGVWRVAGILATSRALGDFPLKERNFITAEPDILTFRLSEVKPKFMILATDGLWDTFRNEEAVSFIEQMETDDGYFGAHTLVMQSYGRGSLDNISVMVVKF